MRSLFLSLLLRSHLSRVIYYRIDIWKTPWGLIINNVCHVSVDIMELILNIFRRFRDCNFRVISQPNVKNKRSYFTYKNNIFGKKEHLLSNWESREWKHPKIIKGKLFKLIAFLISVTKLPAASWTKCYARLSINLHKCLSSFGYKAYFENLRWQGD